MNLSQFMTQDKNLAAALIVLGATVPWLGKAIYDSAYPGTFHSSRGVINGILSDQTPCGVNPDEAIAKGCHFESYTATWQLPQCYDKDLDEEFRALRPWKFYLDKNGTTEVTLAELESGVRQAWTTWEFHLWQCAFYWKKEVKIAHGLTSGSISTHQCLDNSLMQESKHPKDHIKAVAHGCVYDEVLLHWMPPECSSRELIDEFVHVWPWRFWTDKSATQELSLAEVRQGNQVADKWVSLGLHRWHCVATWKSLTHAVSTGSKVPAFVLDWNHTVHCSDHVLMNMHPGSPFDINSHLDIEYTPCVSLETDKTLG
ncbi:hypothetical protein LZ31DRAFT_600881 [Colletotrichum somersetense]|nr:hypothetical protein LZ31DRAFT_600881 [Colletotrichum somersetense]